MGEQPETVMSPEPVDGADDEDVEIEMALLSLLAARDVGDATEPIDLAALSPTEKQVLLQMMRQNIGFVEPPQLLAMEPDTTRAVGSPAP